MPIWWNGRHAGLRSQCLWRAGSSPVVGTNLNKFMKKILILTLLIASCGSPLRSLSATQRAAWNACSTDIQDRSSTLEAFVSAETDLQKSRILLYSGCRASTVFEHFPNATFIRE